MMLQTAVQECLTLIYVMFLYCCPLPSPISLVFVLFPSFSNLSLYEDGEPPSSVQAVSKAQSQKPELTSVRWVSICIRQHLAELSSFATLLYLPQGPGLKY